MAVEPWKEVLKELRADRGMLLGTEIYSEMNGVEKQNALGKIDSAIFAVKETMDKHMESYIKAVKRKPIWKRGGWKDGIE